MANRHWTLDDLPWDQLDTSKVNGDLLKVVKTAALVEYNARDYATYLCNVFHDDPPFQAATLAWAVEEVQHGEALGRWAGLVDPAFNFQEAFRRFQAGFRLPHLNASSSIRGSRSGELVARCMVETGTSSYYTALAESTEEPVLKQICRHIAADELRHYKLFYINLRRYLEREALGRFHRVRVALARVAETEDDELAYAYFAANGVEGEAYHRESAARAYARRAFGYYRQHHIERVVAMVFKACGLKPQTVFFAAAKRVAWWLIDSKVRQLSRLAA